MLAPTLEATGLGQRRHERAATAVRAASADTVRDLVEEHAGVALRRQLGVKNLLLGQALKELEEERIIDRTPTGWRLSTQPT